MVEFRQTTAKLLNRCPLAPRETELVARWARDWTERRVNEQGLDMSDLTMPQIEAMDIVSQADILRQIGQGDLAITRRNGLHLHSVTPGLDPYFTCIRCYGD